jgi:hypothetical protein
MMIRQKYGIIPGAILLLVLVLLLLPLQVVAQDEDTEEKRTNCNPVMFELAGEMGIGCQALVELQNGGAGLGEIMKAWHLSQNIEAYNGDWQTLLEMKQQNVGWGQFKMAYRLAESSAQAEQLLTLKQSGMGWGQIRKAQAISEAGLGLTFEQALEFSRGDMDWGEFQEQRGLPPGPPPWSSGNKERENQGKSPWANGNNGPDSAGG